MKIFNIFKSKIPVVLTMSTRRYWISDPRNKDDIDPELPSFFLKIFNFYYQLNKEIHFWMVENNIEYEICHSLKHHWYLNFKSKSDAVHFKIVWG
jgi:hypothetical protein